MGKRLCEKCGIYAPIIDGKCTCEKCGREIPPPTPIGFGQQ